jgi:hypothetical protein
VLQTNSALPAILQVSFLFHAEVSRVEVAAVTSTVSGRDCARPTLVVCIRSGYDLLESAVDVYCSHSCCHQYWCWCWHWR